MPQKNKSKRPARAASKKSGVKGWLKARTLVQRAFLVLLALMMVGVSVMYGTAQWYVNKHKHEPLVYGATFVPSYAEYFGLDPKDTMQAMIDELGIKRFRLVSYWSDYEKEPGQYDFTELDWQFRKAEAAGAKVSLAIGLRQPRWPECHMPTWAERLTKEQWTAELKKYMKVVIERYKTSTALQDYQLENEFFMKVFGICPDHTRSRLVEEYEFVKTIDSEHPVIISRSNNWIGLPLGDPRPDGFAISVYKRVWDKNITKRYFEYPLPSLFYASLAGGAEILTGKNMIIHELQGESWLPENKGFAMNDINSIDEQNKSINPERLKDRLAYAEATGMKTIDLWGVEWWYWQKMVAGEPGMWDTAAAELAKSRAKQQN